MGRIGRTMMARRRGGMLLQLVLVYALLLVTSAVAQNAGPGLDLLRPPSTLSPRDTLRAFVNDFNESAQAWYRGEVTDTSRQAFARAAEMLEFSSTPNGDSFSVQIERVIMLKEILDRVEIPPDNEIPGVQEVAEKGITRWTIPNTRITLTQVAHGPAAGEFRFSARTVERADNYYRRVENAPYKPGATQNILRDYLAASDTFTAVESRLRDRLKPISTSSPRWLFQGFLEKMNRAHRLITEAEAALNATPPAMTVEQALEAEARAGLSLRRAVGGLDLSQVPPAQRIYVGLEAVLKIKEILDRTPLPPLGSVPSERTVAAAREAAREAFVGNDLRLRWKIPSTELEIAEVTEGDRNGEFLFSARTVQNIDRYFDDVRDLPYRPDSFRFSARFDYISPDKSEGIYELITATPGYLVPSAHVLGNVVVALPDWFKTLYGEQAVWQWLGFLCLTLAVAGASYAAFRVTVVLRAHVAEPWNHWVSLFAPLAIVLILMLGERVIDNDLNLTGEFFFAVVAVDELLTFAVFGWAVYVVSVAIAETIIHSPKIPDQSIDASLLRIASRVVGGLLGGWVFIDGIDEVGFDVVPLLASLGIGGLAVALAAQTTIANFIGSIILYANRPVRVGDFCRYGDDIGTVEEIGIHSTRIRSLERTVVTVPNAEFARMQLDNFTMRDERLLKTTLQLRYETTPEQLRYLLARLRQLLLTHPMVTPEPARVRSVDLASYSQDVEIFAYLRCQDQSTFLAIK